MMNQQQFSSLPRPSPLQPSESLQPTILSLCTGMEEPALVPKLDTAHVTTKFVPAVTHEYVQPLQDTYLKKKITREIHTHDVYHRVLPIIDTETLPTRHFIDDGANIREVSAEDVWTYTVTGRPGQMYYEQQPGEQPRGQYTASDRKAAKLQSEKQEAILADKKTYITDGGYPRTEYLWLHPPVFEGPNGTTRPVRIPAGFSPEWKALLMKQDCHSETASASSGDISQEEDEMPMTSTKRRRTQDSGRHRSLEAHDSDL